MDLSIIIVNWNTCEITLNCLNSIYNNTRDIIFEVIVIDNHSTDDSVYKISECYPQVKLIQNNANMGFAGANNIGLSISEGDYILLLNSDTLILDDVIKKTLTFYKNEKDCGFLGCRVLNKDKTLQPTCFMFPSILNMIISIPYLNTLFKKNIIFGREQMTWWKRDDKRHVQTVTGCYMLTSRRVINKIGMMDDSFFMYGEETDLCMRSIKKGYTNIFSPEGEIIHLGGASTNKVRPQMILQLRSGILHFIYKHHTRIYYTFACILTSLWFFVRIPYWGLHVFISKDSNIKDIFYAYIKGTFKSLGGYKALSIK